VQRHLLYVKWDPSHALFFNLISAMKTFIIFTLFFVPVFCTAEPIPAAPNQNEMEDLSKKFAACAAATTQAVPIREALGKKVEHLPTAIGYYMAASSAYSSKEFSEKAFIAAVKELLKREAEAVGERDDNQVERVRAYIASLDAEMAACAKFQRENIKAIDATIRSMRNQQGSN